MKTYWIGDKVVRQKFQPYLQFGVIDGGESSLEVCVLSLSQVVDVVEGHGEARRHTRRHILLLLARQPGGVLQGLYLLQTSAHLLRDGEKTTFQKAFYTSLMRIVLEEHSKYRSPNAIESMLVMTVSMAI